jgi:hypothetical protein
MDDKDYRRLETLVNSIHERFAAFQAELAVTIKTYKEDLVEFRGELHQIRDLANETYAKVTNGLTDRVKKLEQRMDCMVPRHEVNGALDSLRNAMDENYKSTRKLMIQLILIVTGLFGVALGAILGFA